MYPKPSPNQIDETFKLLEELVLFVGHTHLPWYERCVKQMVMNLGTVNFPLNGRVGAQYALLHWDGGQWRPEFRAIPYDLDAFKRSNEETGFLDTGILAKLFLEEVLCGKAISFDFFLQAHNLADEAGVGQLQYYPDEIWERAGRDFRPSV